MLQPSVPPGAPRPHDGAEEEAAGHGGRGDRLRSGRGAGTGRGCLHQVGGRGQSFQYRVGGATTHRS